MRVAPTRQPQPEPQAGPGAAPAQVEPVRHAASGARPDVADSGPPVFTRAAIDKVLASGPGWLLGRVPLEPVRNRDRKFAGFRIVSVFDDTPTALRYGVRPGDVLLRAQGQNIVTPGDLLTVFQRLKTAQEVTVDVLREGEPRAFRWPIVDPAKPQPRVQDRAEPPPAEPEREAPTP